MQSVKNCFSHKHTECKARGSSKVLISPSDGATRTTRYYDDFYIIRKRNLSWLENRLAWAKLNNKSCKTVYLSHMKSVNNNREDLPVFFL